MTDDHLFNNISLGGRVGNNPGQFKLYSGGLAWKKQGGGKAIEVDKVDIASVTWKKIPRSYQLSVGTKEGIFYRFSGFREQDVSNLTNFIQKNTGISPEEKQLSVSGHNWGGIEINGNMLSFNVGTKEAFEVSLEDVAQTQMQGKTYVVLEFHVDDTTGANEFLRHLRARQWGRFRFRLHRCRGELLLLRLRGHLAAHHGADPRAIDKWEFRSYSRSSNADNC